MSGDVLGMPMGEVPEDITPICAVVVFKAMDEEGNAAYYLRATEGLSTVEAVGMVEYGAHRLRQIWDTP